MNVDVAEMGVKQKKRERKEECGRGGDGGNRRR